MSVTTEIVDALEVTAENATRRQLIIKGVYAELFSKDNFGKYRNSILEDMIIKNLNDRRRKLITQGEYRDTMRVLEMFYFKN